MDKIQIEKWYQSRRIWSVIITLLTTIGIVISPEQYELIVGTGALVASALGITSWRKPKLL